MFYSTTNFNEALIQSIINYMTENKVEIFPLDFLATKQDDRQTVKNAKLFVRHGWKYFTVEDGNLVLHGTWDHLGKDFLGQTFQWIIVPTTPKYEPETIHHCILTADLLALVEIAYDTIGSVHFTGKGVDSYDSEDIDELEASYEARRNEI